MTLILQQFVEYVNTFLLFFVICFNFYVYQFTIKWQKNGAARRQRPVCVSLSSPLQNFP